MASIGMRASRASNRPWRTALEHSGEWVALPTGAVIVFVKLSVRLGLEDVRVPRPRR